MKYVLDLNVSVRQLLAAGLLVYLLLTFVPVYQGTDCGRTHSQEFSAAQNRALRNATIWSGRVGTLVGCVSLCHSWTACKSVNYFKNNQSCDLNNATRVDLPNNIVADYGSVFFDGNPYSDCQSLLKSGYSVSGIYTIFPAGFADGLRVYCDMDTDGGGWLVIQRRQDGIVGFFRAWADYRIGFGNLAGGFWLGNDNLRTLSNSAGPWDLRIDLEDWDNNTAWAEYRDFKISGQDFSLSYDSYNSDSNAGDSLNTHNGMPFSTYDKDNDMFTSGNCADDKKGAWWYNACSSSNLNGLYFLSSREKLNDFRVIAWSSWKGYIYSLKGCSMKIRLAE